MTTVKNISLRYLRSTPRSRSALAMTIISVLGIAIGVATLVVTTSVAGGFGEAYRKSILDFSAHVVLLSMDEISGADDILERLTKFDEIRGVNPFIYREGLLINRGEIRGVVIKGVEPEGFKKISGVDLKFSRESDRPLPVFLGSYLAKEMGVNAGDEVNLMLPSEDVSLKNFMKMRVDGVFEAGMYDVDSQFVLMDIKDAQAVFNIPDTVSGIEIKIPDPEKTAPFITKLEGEFAYPLYATDWIDLNRSLFEAVKLEKIMFIIIMGALVIVAAFNIIGTVMLRILYKTSDISLLRALGMEVKKVKRIFVIQGFIVGLLGTLLGAAVALLFIWVTAGSGWVEIPAEIYLIKTLPVCISWQAVILIAAFSIFVCLLTSYVASKKVGGLNMVKGLHSR